MLQRGNKTLTASINRKLKARQSIEWLDDVLKAVGFPRLVRNNILKNRNLVYCGQCDRFGTERSKEDRAVVPYNFTSSGWTVPAKIKKICWGCEVMNGWHHLYQNKKKIMARKPFNHNDPDLFQDLNGFNNDDQHYH